MFQSTIVPPVRKPAAIPFKIVNAECPRSLCGGDVYFDPATGRTFCRLCAARRAMAAGVQTDGKAVRK